VNPGMDPSRILRGRHRIRIPNIGFVRVHNDLSGLRHAMEQGAVPKSARLSTTAGRWYLCLNLTFPVSVTPLRAQMVVHSSRRDGWVGVDVSVPGVAALSDGRTLRYGTDLKRWEQRFARIDARLTRKRGPSRDRPASQRWRSMERRRQKLEHQLALERERLTHHLTKALCTRYPGVCIQDPGGGPLAAARNGARGNPSDRGGAGGHAILSQFTFSEFCRQLTYKARWYGCELHVVDRQAPLFARCSRCGAVKPKPSLTEHTFHCVRCGAVTDRSLNTARNIAVWADPDGTRRPREAGDTKRDTEGVVASRQRSLLRCPSPPSPGAARATAR
jgi:putative transposase